MSLLLLKRRPRPQSAVEGIPIVLHASLLQMISPYFKFFVVSQYLGSKFFFDVHYFKNVVLFLNLAPLLNSLGFCVVCCNIKQRFHTPHTQQYTT